MNSCLKTIASFLCFSIIIGAEVDTSFSIKWTDLPWGSGGYTQMVHRGAW